MAKVFRLHTGATNTISGWGDSVKIGSTAIDKIQDPSGATNKREITSIPSPFARMDLIKNAFKIVSDSALDGDTIYHKLVSDALDVGQIFFNIEKYRDCLEIIVWDKNNALSELSCSSFEEHKRLGRTYETFIEQDQDEYHFDHMDCIYLLNYIAPSAPDEMNIIGATSPATLFFTSANDLSYVSKGSNAITFGNDKPFDNDFVPLYRRDEAYIKYWWSLKKSRQDFAALFPEVNSYLDKCYNYFSPNLKRELQSLSQDSYESDYDDISVYPMAQNYVMILDQRLKSKRIVNVVDSDFEMKISRTQAGGKTPLALPVETFNDPLKYVIDTWDKNISVPYVDNRPIEDRTLPNDGTKYPYVTISDFLEDTIVKIPEYQFNYRHFFDGNDDKRDSRDSYLLPIKKEFFNYFTVKDLMGKVGNKDMLEIKRLAGDTGVKVVLRIPIKQGFIKYERIYYKADRPDICNNKGVIVTRKFTLAVLPLIKYAEGIKPYYRVSVLDRETIQNNENNHYDLSFYDSSNQLVPIDEVVRRNTNADGLRFDGDKVDSATYAISKDYQYIRVSNNASESFNAIIIPIFVTKSGNHKFRFAIDFGTTNTHIEYSLDGGSSMPFNISETDMQIQTLHNQIDDFELIDVLRSDFVAATIGDESIYSYPMRTVLAESNNTNWSRPVFSMAHVNIPYTYEKSLPLSYNVLHTDLKWSTKIEDKQRAAKYIECLLVMLRNKVLLNNGDLSKTEIVWFYPASMTQSRFNKFKDEWETSFRRYFNAPISNIIAISESVAPYYYNKTKKGATSTVVSIDIGGGTTDVLIVDNGEPRYLTSFRFAANTIFGDGYSYDSESNGFVNKYAPVLYHLLDENNLTNLKKVLKSLLERKVSTDIIAFFFSLAGNKETKDVIDFEKMLADDGKAKYAVILFYTAIIYHVAMIMKAKSVAMPRHITFSGNGSKILNVLSTNTSTLERFTKLIFEKVYNQSYSRDGLSIIHPDNSKESTCMGGICLNPFQSQDYSQINDMKTILLGNDETTFVSDRSSYKDIDGSSIDGIVKSVENFIDFTFALNRDFSFFEEFDADRAIMEGVKELCYRDLRTYLENGISLKKRDLEMDGADDKIEESLFFYPLVGILNAIIRNVYQL